jgi:hypothetical protein
VIRGRLSAYLLRYQMRDFVVLRAALPTAMAVFVAWMAVKTDARGMEWNSPRGHRFMFDILQLIGGAMYIGLAGFLGIARLVTDDRTNGFFRFYFSKPVSIERFYVQQWFLHGAGFVAIIGLLGLWLQSVTIAVPIGGLMTVMGLTWILVGGVGFFLSVVTNYDAVILVFAFIGSKMLHGYKDAEGSGMSEWLRQLTRLSLPTQKLNYIQNELFMGRDLPWPHTLHVAGYGLVAFVLGVVLLRRRSFAR